MFLRSKYEKENNNSEFYLNPVINTEFVHVINRTDDGVAGILFLYSPDESGARWNYPSKVERNKEYEWVLSQLDCKANEEGDIKVPTPPRPAINR